ncbi:uncharacterized protein LOC126567133 [Anopheles maculipalpis]|uniref:uncharacterized protein LOC126567133 n=1 Tax=Anopheles maculipalpis TaxID=1496333 RepID=UPI0021597DF6|nr:uncharacterized protein LOC126567133 [Anopheles maculipalpis]
MSRWSLAISFACIVMFCLTVQADRQEEVTAYVSQYAAAKQKQHSGVFNCWILEFYAISNTQSSILSDVTRQLNDQHISVLQSDHQATHVPIYREPNMVIVLWGNDAKTVESFNIHWWISSIPYECPTFILFEVETMTQPWLIGAYFATRLATNFALIALNVDVMYTFHYEPFRISTYWGFPSHSELFFDRLQTLQKKTINAAFAMDFYTAMFCENLPGEDRSLFILFAETLQFSVNYREMQCGRNETMASCLDRYSDSHIILNRLYLTHYNKFCVSRTAMEQITIATPKGRLLTVWEMLLKPFQQSAWTVIFAIIAACQLVQQLTPTLFVNNLLNLALFGFEKRKLHLTKFIEKVTSTALIILFFQLKCAYEAKLVSYLTETPRVPEARSIEELRARNITVYYGKLNIDHVEKLNGLVALYEGDQMFFDGVTLLDNRESLMAEKLFSENVPNYALPYTILPDNVFEILPFYVFGVKSPFSKRFHTYQQRMFEAGMQLHWRQEYLNCFLLHIVSARHDARGANTKFNAAIRYDQLKPLMRFFLGLWAFAIVIFVVEIIHGRYSAYKRSGCGATVAKQKQGKKS